MRKKSLTTNNKNKKKRASGIIFLPLPLLGLLLPFIIYVFTYSPILTGDMADEISFARFLAANNSHTFTEGWISTKEFFPLSIRFFMTMFASENRDWTSVLFFSALCCYLIFSAAFLFFVISLRLKNLLSYSITAVVAIALGYYCLIATYDCNYFITYITFLLIIAGLIALAIRSRFALPIRIAIGSMSGVLIICTIVSMSILSRSYSFTTLNFSSFSSLFTSPLNPAKALTDITPSVAGITGYLQSRNVTDVYSTSDITNQIALISENKQNVTYLSSINNLTPTVTTDRILKKTSDLSSTEDSSSVTVSSISDSNVTLIVSADDLLTYDSYLKFGDIIYQDNYYYIYNFDSSLLLTDDTIHNELTLLREQEFDTVLLSMYDISTVDVSRLYTAKLWTCYMTNYIFTDISVLDTYNEQILIHNPSRYFLCIDPYIIYSSFDYNESAYTEFITATLSSMIENNSQTDFRIILPSYYAYHYKDFDNSDYSHMRSSYEILLNSLAQYPNLSFNYFGYQEYLYSNASLYINGSDSVYVPEVADTLLLETLADDDHIMNANIVMIYLDSFIDDMKNYPYNEEPDYSISPTNIVILGDSIFGNFKDNTSIQSIISFYSKANTVCMAIGGAHAAYLDNDPEHSLSYQLDKDEINNRINENGSTADKTVFILEFGINDYLSEIPIKNNNRYDESTYSGSLRSSIETIQSTWPESDIILLIPGHMLYNDDGKLHSSKGSSLDEYRKAAISIADEYNCSYFNLCDTEITKENCNQYLSDQIHYNGPGRYVVAMSLLEYLSDIY